jgi:prephenate dehydratase
MYGSKGKEEVMKKEGSERFDGRTEKTSLVFTLKQTVGSLAECLEIFKVSFCSIGKMNY